MDNIPELAESTPGCEFTDWCDSAMGVLCLDCTAIGDLKQRLEDIRLGATGGKATSELESHEIHESYRRFTSALTNAFKSNLSFTVQFEDMAAIASFLHKEKNNA